MHCKFLFGMHLAIYRKMGKQFKFDVKPMKWTLTADLVSPATSCLALYYSGYIIQSRVVTRVYDSKFEIMLVDKAF